MLQLFKKLRQVWRDHQAMQTVRQHRGDVYLVSTIGPGPNQQGFDCYLFQRAECVSHDDPAQAILAAFEAHRQGRLSAEPIRLYTYKELHGALSFAFGDLERRLTG